MQKTFRGEIFKEPTVTLYRPVGPKELELIKKSKWKRFPPRLSDQPIFYTIISEDYAIKIARDWNVPASGEGHVLEFYVKHSYLSKFDVQDAGGKSHREYWIPAEELEEFNDNIMGKIWKIKSYYVWFVYILQCSDGTLYTGITNNLQKRIEAHNKGAGAKYTRGRGPVTLIKSFEVMDKGEALKIERRIKKLSRDQKLELKCLDDIKSIPNSK